MTIKHNEADPKPLSEDERHQLMLRHAKEFTDALGVKQKSDADFKNVCKRIKLEGSSADRVKEFIALGTPAGAAAAKADIEATIMMARWRNADIGTQFDFFRDDGAKGTEENASFKAGKEVGLAGGAAQPAKQWDAGEWMRGWQAGQAVNASGFQKKPDEFDVDETGADGGD